jgi:hypothetical protein
MKATWIVSSVLALTIGSSTWAASIEDVTFLTRIQVYETVTSTTLVTQEGKKIPLDKGTRVNVAGFTATEALIVSRSDRPNAFVKRADIVPSRESNALEPPRIKEETLPQPDRGTEGGVR